MKTKNQIKCKALLAVCCMAAVATLMLASCGKEHFACPSCGVDNPLRDLRWLKNRVREADRSGALMTDIFSCKYLGDKDGFLICVELYPNSILKLYDCDGNQLSMQSGAGDYYDPVNKPHDFKLIYSNYANVDDYSGVDFSSCTGAQTTAPFTSQTWKPLTKRTPEKTFTQIMTTKKTS